MIDMNDKIIGNIFNLVCWVDDAQRDKIINDVTNYILSRWTEDDIFIVDDDMMQELIDSGQVGVTTMEATEEFKRSGMN